MSIRLSYDSLMKFKLPYFLLNLLYMYTYYILGGLSTRHDYERLKIVLVHITEIWKY